VKLAKHGDPQQPSSLFRGKLVRLAAPAVEDAAEFARWSQDSEYLRFVDTDYALPVSVAEFAERFRPARAATGHIAMHIRTLAEDRLIGFVSIHRIEWQHGSGVLAIGIGDRTYWDHGFGGDALELILRFAFEELNLFRLGLDVIANNERAIHVYERAGFRHEGALRGAVLRDGVRVDQLLMGIMASEWRARHRPNQLVDC
jgi:RimJ/RimL family protein N-acetyltransferase